MLDFNQKLEILIEKRLRPQNHIQSHFLRKI